MADVTRNALKGYTFQQYILTLFIAKMDTVECYHKSRVGKLTKVW